MRTRHHRIRNLIVATLVALVIATAFGYGVGVGYYRWPPFSTLVTIARTVSEPASRPGEASYHAARIAHYRDLRGSADIVMLGDSLTEGGNWHELVPEYRTINRGISGDTSSSVLDRLQEVIERRPKVVFLMVGTNDISLGVPPKVLLTNLREIVTRLRDASITLVAQSILFHGGWQQASNDTIAAVNAEWAAFCATQGVRFLDLNALMAVNSRLPDAMTYDGVHLTAAAYRVWRDAVVRAADEILP
jgi:lysophospholipase L1-like esterase